MTTSFPLVTDVTFDHCNCQYGEFFYIIVIRTLGNSRCAVEEEAADGLQQAVGVLSRVAAAEGLIQTVNVLS